MSADNNKIENVNKLLVKHFGIPPRNKELPDSVDMIIATILSQNTNDNNSYKAYQNLKRKYNSWYDLLKVLKVRRTTIEKEIKVAGLGLQKSRAIKDFIMNLYKERKKISLDHIIDLENSAAISELTKFKGIGVKTASCVLLFAEGRNVCPVDTHVHRTVNRLGIVKASTPDKTFLKLFIQI